LSKDREGNGGWNDRTGSGERMGRLLLYFCFLLAVFAGLFGLTSSPISEVGSTGELATFDFDSSIARVEASAFEWYPDALYTPEDFATGISEAPQPIDRRTEQYGTYRLVVHLPVGQVYGLSAYSATYAQELWINGELLSQVGMPGIDAATTVHKTDYYTVYFTAGEGPTEIIIQRADFAHSQGGQLYPQYLGQQERIATMVGALQLRGGIIVGCMLVAALLLLGFFLFLKGHRQFLWFALCCLMVAVRTLFTDHKLIMLFFPNMDWQISHRVEYIATLGLVVFFILYMNTMFGRRLPHALSMGGLALCGVCLLVIVCAPSPIYTRLIPWAQVLGLAYALAVFILVLRLMLKECRYRGLEQGLVLFSILALASLVLADIVRYRFTGQFDDLNLTQLGMIVFTFANMLALVLNFSRTESALAETRRQAEELERLEQMRHSFLSDISHEMRTPLTVISNYAQYTRIQLDDGTADEDTKQNLLTITLEAQRLSLLVQQLLSEQLEQAGTIGAEQVVPEELISRVAALCRPILQKNENQLHTDVSPQCPPLRANLDTMVQVLVNLCVNANRHTHGGHVSITARQEGEAVALSVKDTGEGIPPDLLPQVFDRGVSGDGETGLGLAICREVVESYGGEIGIESEPDVGTRVWLSIPIFQSIQT
jgi:signal transduction histidine kinase